MEIPGVRIRLVAVYSDVNFRIIELDYFEISLFPWIRIRFLATLVLIPEHLAQTRRSGWKSRGLAFFLSFRFLGSPFATLGPSNNTRTPPVWRRSGWESRGFLLVALGTLEPSFFKIDRDRVFLVL